MVTPVVNPGTFSLNLPVTNGQVVGTMTASGSPTTWAITAGNVGGAWAISNSGVLTVANAGAVAAGAVSLTVQACVPAGDPFFSSVVLLLGFEGTNGATSAPGMNDESPSAHGTATVAGTTAISTASKEFGNSSLLNASGGRITFPNSSDWDFGAGSFTVEFWMNASSFAVTPYVVSHYGNSSNFGWSVYLDSSGVLGFVLSTTGIDNFTLNGSTVMSTGTWYHVAVDYNGSKYRTYVNGVNDGSASTPHTIFNPSIPLSVGGNTLVGGRDFSGYIDELRITKGFARYASDAGFTVPTAAFPRS